MGIRFQCPSGHKLNVKAELAGKRASCPECGAKLVIPAASTEPEASRISPAALSSGDWYVRPAAGGQFGPATDAVFRTWISQGRVTADSLVWRDDWTQWKLARDAADDLPIPLAAIPIPAAPSPVAVVPAAVVPAQPQPFPGPTIETPLFPSPIDVAADSIELAALPTEMNPNPSSALKASGHAFQRRRSQRSQFTLAVVMLVAVIVLAVVLVLVIRNNLSATSGAENSASANRTAAGWNGYAVDFNRLAQPSEAA